MIRKMLGNMNRTLNCQERDDEYGQLKFYNDKYEDLSLEGASKKNRVSHLIDKLFPDLQLKPRQFYSEIIACVIQECGLNPYAIHRLHSGDFLKSIKK